MEQGEFMILIFFYTCLFIVMLMNISTVTDMEKDSRIVSLQSSLAYRVESLVAAELIKNVEIDAER